MKDNTIEQKTFEADFMIDYFLLGEDWAMKSLIALQTAQNIGDTAHGLANDVRAIQRWREKKKQERELVRKQKEKEKQQKAAGFA